MLVLAALVATMLVLWAPFFWCCCSVTVTITVTGCNGLPLPGASVEYKQGGVTIASGTTNGSGVYSVTLPTGTYSRTVGKSRFNPVISSLTVTSAGSTTSQALTPADGYSCCTGGDCPDPIASTIYITTSNGTVSLNWSGSTWEGTKAFTPASAIECSSGSCTTTISSSATVTLSYSVACPTSIDPHYRVSVGGQVARYPVGSSNWYWISDDCARSGCPVAVVTGSYPTRNSLPVGSGYVSVQDCNTPLSLSGTLPSDWTFYDEATSSYTSITALDGGSFVGTE